MAMYSNCLCWAIALYRRRKAKGRSVYLMLRRSRYGKFPHFLVAEHRTDKTLRIVSFVPRNPRHKTLPPPIFSGRSKWGDL